MDSIVRSKRDKEDFEKASLNVIGCTYEAANRGMKHMKKYRAFISYSHADKVEANRLLKRLQTYRLPKGITDPHNRRLGDFFMDRESLPAAGSLSDAISTGLANAQALIVLCSPTAAKSEWVGKEIEAFRELNPDKEILAVVLSGDPQSRTDGQACFPSPLIGDNAEPLAADFRKNGDGRKLGFLKLVAALSGTPLETLLRKDQTRQRNRVMAVTALSALITLSMSTLAAVAISARQDAEDRRADAEGLVDFMLTDLRDRLEPLGRLDVLEGVATTALQHYEGEPINGLDCGQIKQKARALHLSIEIKYNQRGGKSEALKSTEQVLSLTGYGLDACPNDADMHREHGVSLFYKSVDDLARKDYIRFFETNDLYAEQISKYCNNKPDADDCILNQAYVENGYGVANLRFSEKRNPTAAIEHFQNAIDLYETTEAFDESQFRILDFHSNGHGWLADAYLAAGAPLKAVDLRELERTLYEGILDERLSGIETSEGRLRRRILGADSGQMRALLAANMAESVLEKIPHVLDRAERLTNHDPDDKRYQRMRWRLMIVRAIAFIKLGREGDACASWKDAETYRASTSIESESIPEITRALGFEIEEFCIEGNE